MELYESLLKRKDIETEIMTENRRTYRELSQVCSEICVDFKKPILEEQEKRCLSNCHGKLFFHALPRYQRYFF
jgi:hypothetical protein